MNLVSSSRTALPASRADAAGHRVPGTVLRHGRERRDASKAIPGAHGFTLTTNETSGHNIVFADGPFPYHLGVGWGNQAPSPPTRAQLIAAARALYERVHSRPAPSL